MAIWDRLRGMQLFQGNPEVLALSFARMGDAIGNAILIIVIPLLITNLPSPLFPITEPERVGVLIALYGLLAALVQPIGGSLVDRTNRHKLFILAGLAAMAIATLGFSFATTFTDLMALRALQGIGFALTVPASLAIVTIATQRTTRGGSMGIYNSSRFLGFAIGPLIGGYLYTAYGADLAFYVGAGFILLAIGLVQVYVKEVKAPEKGEQPQKAQAGIELGLQGDQHGEGAGHEEDRKRETADPCRDETEALQAETGSSLLCPLFWTLILLWVIRIGRSFLARLR
ncbi:MAG TPA: MFS transporter, partial [Methanomicrobiales archaeon]|nr:MFS transporter [Methanomicrobiales archaeon]